MSHSYVNESFVVIHMWMSHSYVNELFICVNEPCQNGLRVAIALINVAHFLIRVQMSDGDTLIQMFGMTHSYVLHVKIDCDGRLQSLMFVAKAACNFFWHDSFKERVTSLMFVAVAACNSFWHDSFKECVTWLIAIAACNTNSYQNRLHAAILYNKKNLHGRLTCLIRMCDVTHSHMNRWWVVGIARSYCYALSHTFFEWVVSKGIADSHRYYGVATMSRRLKIIGLFGKRNLQKRRYSAKETYNFKGPTTRSHPIPWSLRHGTWLVHTRDITHQCMHHESFICATSLINMCCTNRSFVRHESYRVAMTHRIP